MYARLAGTAQQVLNVGRLVARERIDLLWVAVVQDAQLGELRLEQERDHAVLRVGARGVRRAVEGQLAEDAVDDGRIDLEGTRVHVLVVALHVLVVALQDQVDGELLPLKLRTDQRRVATRRRPLKKVGRGRDEEGRVAKVGVLLELGRLVEVGQERSQGRREVLLGGDLLLAVGQHLIRGF